MHKAKNIYFLHIQRKNEMAQGRVPFSIILFTIKSLKDAGLWKKKQIKSKRR